MIALPTYWPQAKTRKPNDLKSISRDSRCGARVTDKHIDIGAHRLTVYECDRLIDWLRRARNYLEER